MNSDIVDQRPDVVAESREIAPTQHSLVPSSYALPTKKQIKEYRDFLKHYDEFVGSMLKKDVDYGEIPGVTKPTLLKPGAEKLEKLFFLRSEKECTEKVITEDYSFVKYTYRTKVYNKMGQIVATCEGSCNSNEKKYRYESVMRESKPTKEEADSLKAQKLGRWVKRGEEWVWFDQVEKKDFYDLENTIMKMAQKRSYVGAILEATNSSSRFTQDVEDMPDVAEGREHADKPAQSGAATPAASSAPSEAQISTIQKLMDQKGYSVDDLIDQGFPPLEKLTGSKTGTASELIGWLIKAKSKEAGSQHAVNQEEAEMYM